MNRAYLLIPSLIALAALAGPSQSEPSPGCTPALISDAQSNLCLGSDTLPVSTGGNNTAVGAGGLKANTTGDLNTAVGTSALEANTTGSANVAVGGYALFQTVEGSQNSALGYGALSQITSGSENTGIGAHALSNAIGMQNSALGVKAGYAATGNANTFVGYSAGADVDATVQPTGSNNIAIGVMSGSKWSAGSNNIAIGAAGTTTDAATIRLGVQGTQTKAFIAGIYGSRIARRGSSTVLVDSTGQLGTIKSSIRYKQDVLPMGDASNPLLKLRPVTFHYKEADADGTKPLQYGLIAEEVAQVMPDLVVADEDGTPETVAYHLLPSLLLNEYQKQNRELVETKAELAAMRQELASIKAALGRLAEASPQGRTQATAAVVDTLTLE